MTMAPAGTGRTVLVPDFAYRETEDWIVFPWSARPPVTVEEGAA